MAPHRRTKPTDSSSAANPLHSTRSNRANRSSGSNGTNGVSGSTSANAIDSFYPSRAPSVAASSGIKSRQGSQLPQVQGNSTSVAYPPTPPSQDDEDYDTNFDGGEDSGSTPNQTQRFSTPDLNSNSLSYPHRRPNHSPSASMSLSGAYPLQRGSACLSCRKRKLKCSGSRPVCEQCSKTNRAADCEFDDGKAKTRTQLLQEKIAILEARIRELEPSASATAPVPVPISIASAPSSTSASANQVLQLNDSSYQDTTSSVSDTFYIRFTVAPLHPPLSSSDAGLRRLTDKPPQTFNSSDDRFNFDMIVDRPLNQDPSLGYEFGNGTSSSSVPSAPSGYEQHQLQLQLSQVIDAACGTGSSSVTVPSQQPLSVSEWPHPHTQTHAPAEPVPAQLRQLLEMVLPHFPLLGLDLQPSPFLQSLNLPPNHPLHPHPSLLNALYLHACALSPPDHYLHGYQNRFLVQTRRAINESLQFNDRILDTLRAQCLLATWYFGHGRMLEGYDVVCAASRFAVGCELNRIVSPIWPNSGNINALSNIHNNIHNISNISAEALAAENRNREPSQQGLGIGLPALAATAAASGSGPNVTDRDGNLTHPRYISLNFGIGLLPTASIAVTRDQHQYQSGRASPAISGIPLPLSNPSGAGGGASGVSGLSVACSKINPIINAPNSAKELGERVLLFWRIFNLDRFWSVVCGLQPALSEDEIMTVWPRSIEDYETGNVSDNEYASVRSLGVRRPSNSSAMRPDSKAALLSKSITLFERSARLAASLSSVQPPTEAFWVAFRLMEDSISQMLNNISPYRRRSVGNVGVDSRFGTSSQSGSHRASPTSSGQGESSPSSSGQFPISTSLSPLQSSFGSGSGAGAGAYEVDSTLVLVHILLRSAAAQLHNIFAQEDPNSYQKSFAAARAAATIIGEVAEVIRNVDGCNLMLGPCLTLISDVLIREATRGTMSSMNSIGNIGNMGGMMNPPNSMNGMGSMGGPGGMENIERDLEAVLFMLNAIGHKYPLVRRQASLVEAAKEAVIARHRQSQQLAVNVNVGNMGGMGVNVGMPMSIPRMSY